MNRKAIIRRLEKLKRSLHQPVDTRHVEWFRSALREEGVDPDKIMTSYGVFEVGKTETEGEYIAVMKVMIRDTNRKRRRQLNEPEPSGQ